MPRVIRHPDIRRAELLDRARLLFVERGYENVSLNDLIADAGVSKGAFYHWFPSKDALIAALAERSAHEGFAPVEHALAQHGGNALDRLNAVLQAGFDVKIKMGTPEQLAAMVSLLRPDNAHLYGRIVTVEENLFRPLLTRVISDGVAEGAFDTFDPESVADMIYALAARTNSKILDVLNAADKSARDHAIDALTTRFRLNGPATDRILGLPDGSITNTDPCTGRNVGRGATTKLLMRSAVLIHTRAERALTGCAHPAGAHREIRAAVALGPWFLRSALRGGRNRRYGLRWP